MCCRPGVICWWVRWFWAAGRQGAVRSLLAWASQGLAPLRELHDLRSALTWYTRHATSATIATAPRGRTTVTSVGRPLDVTSAVPASSTSFEINFWVKIFKCYLIQLNVIELNLIELRWWNEHMMAKKKVIKYEGSRGQILWGCVQWARTKDGPRDGAGMDTAHLIDRKRPASNHHKAREKKPIKDGRCQQ